MPERGYNNRIKIVPVYAVKEIINNQIKLKPGYRIDSFYCFTPPTPTEESGGSTNVLANLFFLRVYVENLSSEQKEKYGIQCEVILILYKKDDEMPLLIGNIDNPVTMIRVPEETSDLLTFTRSSYISVL